MNKLIVNVIAHSFFLLLPYVSFGAGYSPEYIFNQNSIEEAIKIQYNSFLRTNKAKELDDIIKWQKTCLEILADYGNGKNVPKDIAIQAYQQFLTSEIILTAIKIKYKIEPVIGDIENRKQLLYEIYSLLKKSNLIKDDWAKFAYLYNETLNKYGPLVEKMLDKGGKK